MEEYDVEVTTVSRFDYIVVDMSYKIEPGMVSIMREKRKMFPELLGNEILSLKTGEEAMRTTVKFWDIIYDILSEYEKKFLDDEWIKYDIEAIKEAMFFDRGCLFGCPLCQFYRCVILFPSCCPLAKEESGKRVLSDDIACNIGCVDNGYEQMMNVKEVKEFLDCLKRLERISLGDE